MYFYESVENKTIPCASCGKTIDMFRYSMADYAYTLKDKRGKKQYYCSYACVNKCRRKDKRTVNKGEILERIDNYETVQEIKDKNKNGKSKDSGI